MKINNELLEEFKKEAELFKDKADEISSGIRAVETFLQQNGVNIEYGMIIKEDTRNVFLSWSENGDKFRLILSIHYPPEIALPITRKPLVEFSLSERVKYYSFLEMFLQKYMTHLKETRELINKK